MYSIEEVRMTDPEIAAAIEKEIKRQNDHIELIASENWTLQLREPRNCSAVITQTYSPTQELRQTLQ